MSTISFLTDYGIVDEFVGVCKGVIRQLAPGAEVLDVTHQIAPHDIRAGSLSLARAIQYLPDGVVLAIVDPGVGTARRAVAVEAGSSILVGPDNGLLAPAVAMLGGARRAVTLMNEKYQLASPGATFAGRDIFAPAAAYLANGVDLSAFGPEVDPITLLPALVPLTRSEDDGLLAEVLWVDRFGNAQLNVDPSEIETLGDPVSISFSGKTRSAKRAGTYADLGTGQVGLIVDSSGLVSICLDRASAAAELGLGEGTGVRLHPAS